MKAGNKKTGVRLRVVLVPGVALGPGKADLLEAIAETGSISAAGRRMTMSYKRAWSLVNEMNGWFAGPLVETGKGGAGGGGAQLTALGERVREAYRRMEQAASAAVEADIAALRAEISDMSK
ncbi:winged helix-turn-helix domain-containing protein [Microbaculum marinisediminis]|uniref:LysR family transcriptional regulator n=1 Tax=Microbaculum marinisediminis TaxID=2931392 RepID=A0AAW5QWP8_9HYPH|nr:LysR family transcriptional regulator [Microbaculum sp. A6E488]MCT8971557.1 LysR family transcriptional regulator [Microbaculum sp. A6E488]